MRLLTRRMVVATALMLAAGLAGRAEAGLLTTVAWAPDGTTNGTGTGTLDGITVTYTTVVGAGNAGITISNNWDVSQATDGAVDMGVTSQTAGIFGTTTVGSPVTQTVTFSSAVLDPILLFNFSDATTTMDFGSQSLTLLDSNNAQLAGSLVSFVGSGNGFNDGFAARLNGTYSSFSFLYFTAGSVTNFDSVAFTVGVSAVPEPSTLTSAGIAGLVGLGALWRRRRRAVA